MNSFGEKEYSVYFERASKEDSVAQLIVAFLTLHGKGVKKSKSEAKKWLEKSSNNRNKNAQLILGFMKWSSKEEENEDANLVAVVERIESGIPFECKKEDLKTNEGNQIFLPDTVLLEVAEMFEAKGEMNKSIWILQKLMDSENLAAAFSLGYIYDTGEGGEKNVKEALRVYGWLSEREHVPGMHNLAMLLLSGQVDRNVGKAVELLEKASEMGDVPSMLSLAEIYQCGVDVEKDERKALKWLVSAAEKKSGEALRKIGEVHKSGTLFFKDEKKAFSWFCKARDAGDVRSLYLIGEMYSTGNTAVEKDEKKALEYFERACEGGDEKGMFKVARALEKGRLLKKDLCGAFELYKKSAELGDKSARLSLARCYLDGIGTEKDNNKAVILLEEYAAKGTVRAMYKLAELLLEGESVSRDVERAIELLDECSKKGNTKSQIRLAKIYAQGIEGVRVDLEKAASMYFLACSEGKSAQQYENQFAEFLKSNWRVKWKPEYNRLWPILQEEIQVVSKKRKRIKEDEENGVYNTFVTLCFQQQIIALLFISKNKNQSKFPSLSFFSRAIFVDIISHLSNEWRKKVD